MDRINVTAHTPAACSAAPWRRAGAWWVTVVVKATFRLVPGQLAQPTAPLPLVREDCQDALSGSLEAASDIAAPYLPGTGVVLTGHAYPPGGRPGTATTARLALGRERPLLDKTLHAYGDRLGTAVQPFEKMPLVYERAYGGPGIVDNPVGVGAPGSAVLPNLYDARRREQPAGFGPISRSWPVRRRLLGNFDQRALHAPEPEIPERLDWRYFHAAPPDQQIEHLRGDEWIVLDGMHPTLARVQTRLPAAVGKARWHLLSSSGAGAGTAIELVADTLIIDADSLVCSILWRGRFALKRPEMAAWIGVSAGVELAGQPLPWTEIKDPARAELETAKTMAVRLPREAMAPGWAPATPNPLAATSGLDLRALGVRVLPFAPAESSSPAAPKPMGDVQRPIVHRASESLSGTASIDFRQIIKAIVPFGPAGAPPLLSADPVAPRLPCEAMTTGRPPAIPNPLAGTSALDLRAMGVSVLPFAAPDPGGPLHGASASEARWPVVERASASVSGTASIDLQQLIKASAPFGPATPPPPLSDDPAVTGAMDARQLRPALPFARFDPSMPVFAAVPQPALPRVPSPLGRTADLDMQQAIRAALPFLGTPRPGPRAVEPARGPVLAIEHPALPPEPPPVCASPTMQAPLSFAPPQAPPAATKPLQIHPNKDFAQDPFHGVSLSDYAAVQAGLTEKVPLEAVLLREGIDAGAWPTADAAWSRRIAEDLSGDGALQEPFDAHLAEAQDRYGRRLPPLDDDLEAWVDFQRRFSIDTNPPALFAQLGLRLAEVARLRRTWSKRLVADPELAAHARRIRAGQPADLAIVLPMPGALS